MTAKLQAKVIEDAVRSGSLASLCFAIVAFATNLIIPRMISQRNEGLDGPRSRRYLPHLNIAQAWSISHFLFATLMFATIISSSRAAATAIVAAVGVSWAFTLWVPFTIIGEEIANRRLKNAKIMEGDLLPTQQDQAGVVMGLHNCAISAPQIIAALMSSVIFWMTRKFEIEDGIGWVLRCGACASLIAGWLASRLDY
jgi:solute carrier family 45 protein 1/2/4